MDPPRLDGHVAAISTINFSFDASYRCHEADRLNCRTRSLKGQIDPFPTVTRLLESKLQFSTQPTQDRSTNETLTKWYCVRIIFAEILIMWLCFLCVRAVDLFITLIYLFNVIALIYFERIIMLVCNFYATFSKCARNLLDYSTFVYHSKSFIVQVTWLYLKLEREGDQ